MFQAGNGFTVLQPQHEEVDRKKEEVLEAKQEPMETEDKMPVVKVEPKEEEDGTNGTSAAQNRRKSRN